jgi:hypothetical protein
MCLDGLRSVFKLSIAIYDEPGRAMGTKSERFWFPHLAGLPEGRHFPQRAFYRVKNRISEAYERFLKQDPNDKAKQSAD